MPSRPISLNLSVLRNAIAVSCAIVSLSLFTAGHAFSADTPQGVNIDAGLQKLYSAAQEQMPEATEAGVHAQIAPVTTVEKQTVPGRFDTTNRVLVHVQLSAGAALNAVANQIQVLKGTVLDTKVDYQHGILAVYLPTDQIENCSEIPGVRALTMEFHPEARVGKYTSQGTVVLQTNTVNSRNLTGAGITVGVLSDSFDTADEFSPPPASNASQDVASGDLPGVNVLQDYPYGTDEGRAMCQVVYDEAPRCHLAFATGDQSEVGFANNIIALRTQANASVIVDDLGYFDEPVFSDGIVAQAVNTVATSTTLPGKPVIYCSAAGNDGNNGYRSAYRNLNDAQVRMPGNHGNLKLNVSDPTSPHYLDPSLTAGGWFNWSPVAGTEPSTTVEAPGPTSYAYAIFLQWDDLFDRDHGVTTNYNFLVFDAQGNYLSYLSSTTNSFAIEEPIQAIGYLSLGTKYQIAITATTQTDPEAGAIPPAHQLALYTTLDGASDLQGKYFQPAPLNVPMIYGHPTAVGAIATAAYDYSWQANAYLPELENFTSPGPAMIYFDSNSQRLKNPVIRQKPEVAGVDGVVTTFFGSGYYNNPFAFFGTSAAAPSVAGVAALMLQKAGGPGSLDSATAKPILEGSTAPRNSTVEMTQALASGPGGSVNVTALGQSYFDANYLTVTYSGGGSKSITKLTIDGTAAGLVFNTTDYAVLGNLKGIAAADISFTPSTDSSKIVITFAPGAFTSGDSFSFTVGQDEAGTYTGYTQSEYGAGVDAEDLSYGATVTAAFSGGNASATAPFSEGPLTLGYNRADGYGLVNGLSAVQAVKAPTATIQPN